MHIDDGPAGRALQTGRQDTGRVIVPSIHRPRKGCTGIWQKFPDVRVLSRVMPRKSTRIHRRVLACVRHSPAPFLEAGACAAVWDVAALLRAARVVQLRHGHASSCVPRAGQNFQRPRVCSVPAVPRCCFGMLQPGCGVWRRGTKSGLHRDCPEWRENGWGAQEWTWDGRTLKNSPKGPRKWTGETVQNI